MRLDLQTRHGGRDRVPARVHRVSPARRARRALTPDPRSPDPRTHSCPAAPHQSRTPARKRKGALGPASRGGAPASRAPDQVSGRCLPRSWAGPTPALHILAEHGRLVPPKGVPNSPPPSSGKPARRPEPAPRISRADGRDPASGPLRVEQELPRAGARDSRPRPQHRPAPQGHRTPPTGASPAPGPAHHCALLAPPRLGRHPTVRRLEPGPTLTCRA